MRRTSPLAALRMSTLGVVMAVLCGLLPARVALGEAQAKRPNIVFILADDMGYGDVGCFGRTDIKTPNIDGLAAAGVRFTDHYANGAECTPTRTAFLTGRYQHRVGGLECAIGTGNIGRYDDAIRLREKNSLGLPVEEQTLVRLLKDSGYNTAITGKWHLGFEPKFAPNLHGFDHTLYCIGGGMDYFHYLDTVAGYNLYRDGDPIRGEGYFTDMATDEALQFLDRQSDATPFFLYLPYTAPHSPFQGPDDYQPHPLPLDSSLWPQGSAPPKTYIAMIERMDTCIGKVLEKLEQQGFGENTVVVFASDNGGTGSARNVPLSGHKGTTWEGGIRVPAIVRWTGVVPSGVESHQPCMTFDFTASFANLAQISPAKDKPWEGIDIIDHVRQQRADVDRSLFWRNHRGTSVWAGVRQGNLKYVVNWRGNKLHEEHLFDLATDIGEKQELKQHRPQEFQKLQARYLAWEKEVRKNRRGQP